MILLLSPLKNDPLETTVSIFFFLEIEIFTTKIVNSKSLKKICRQLLSTMNVLKSGLKDTEASITACLPSQQLLGKQMSQQPCGYYFSKTSYIFTAIRHFFSAYDSCLIKAHFITN